MKYQDVTFVDSEDDDASDKTEQDQETPPDKMTKKQKIWELVPADKNKQELLRNSSEHDLARYQQLQHYLARWPVAFYDLGISHS